MFSETVSPTQLGSWACNFPNPVAPSESLGSAPGLQMPIDCHRTLAPGLIGMPGPIPFAGLGILSWYKSKSVGKDIAQLSVLHVVPVLFVTIWPTEAETSFNCGLKK